MVQIQRTEYQQDVIDARGPCIFIGGRQVGKTTTLVDKAEEIASGGNRVMFLAPSHRMVMEASKTARERCSYDNATKVEMQIGDGFIDFHSAHNLPNNVRHISNYYDAVLVDEAMYIENTTLYKLNREMRNITFAGTPMPEKTFVEMWAQYSPDHQTIHAPTASAPFIGESYLEQFRETLSGKQYELEMEAKYR